MIAHDRVVRLFKDGKTAKGNSMFTDGVALYSWGLHFTLARHMPAAQNAKRMPWILVNVDRYSVSTNQHVALTGREFIDSPHVSIDALQQATNGQWVDVTLLEHTTSIYQVCSRGEAGFESLRVGVPAGATYWETVQDGTVVERGYSREGATLLRLEDKYLLCSADGNHYVTELSGEALTVDDAFTSLMPLEVAIYAHNTGMHALRQGEWYFIPVDRADLPYGAWSRRRSRLPTDTYNYHEVTHLWEHSGNELYVTGTVRHSSREHRMLKLGKGVWKAIRNTAVNSWSGGRGD